MATSMTYAGCGVDYNAMDPFKRACQQAGKETAHFVEIWGLKEVPWTRGESVYLLEAPGYYLAHIEEGLGTKNLAADAMLTLADELGAIRTYYDHIAQCAVAMIVNDIVTLGAMPLTIAMHLAVGHSDWLKTQRAKDLIRGWKHACELAKCTWAGGETPTLRDIIYPNTVVISGSGTGIIRPKEFLFRRDIQAGDAIVMLTSSGIHANGLTLARDLAAMIPQGYQTRMSDGRTYGEALLDPTCIYASAVKACQEAGINVRYGVNITGHGWRKLMRAPEKFAYVIDTLPPPLPIFDFIQEHAGLANKEAYGNLNMGAGFALYMSPSKVKAAIEAIRLSDSGCVAFEAGHIEASPQRRVIINPIGEIFNEDDLNIR